MDPSNLNINEVFAYAMTALAGGVSSHWVKMRRDIKSAHYKIRELEKEVAKCLENLNSKN